MRVLIDLQAEADSSYDPEYHGRLRARIWDALRDTPYDEHSEQTPGFSFSNPFPWGDIEDGDERHLLVASSRETQLAYITADLLNNPELRASVDILAGRRVFARLRRRIFVTLVRRKILFYSTV